MAKPGKLNIPISLKDIRRVKFNIKYVFVLILLLIFIMEFFVIKQSAGIVSASQNQPPSAAPINTSGRINFKDYELIVDRINNAAFFVPTGGITRNPFSSKPGPPAAPAAASASSTAPAVVAPR